MFLAATVDMDHSIDSVVATADHVGAQLRSRKKIDVSFDEWNVWYMSQRQEQPVEAEWRVAPHLLEDNYGVADAVVVGALIITLLRHSDRVTAASLAQLVNVIAPISTDPDGGAWRQTIYYPFALTARYARGRVLRLQSSGSVTSTERYGDVAAVDAVATWDDDHGAVALFLVNRSPAEHARVEVTLSGHEPLRLMESLTLADPDLAAGNTPEKPEHVVPRPLPDVSLENRRLLLTLPAASWTMIRLQAGP